ncbi:DUF3575 domain-containing protein [Rufibacter sp. XAAS-G3-1]|uniref:DUF3575 domain-containing protein n=1 Tax=Rufibacter sp. XAAS-G3-1 TaxID=2729134 RepID=UPI001C62A441|nr:DUF3575 domain-containing protein [Rufibacter sp. XAAS-G3-1]
MRKLFTLLLVLSGLHGFAQTTPSTESDPAGTLPTFSALEKLNSSALEDISKDEVFRKNILKINLSSLALSNYSLSYERSLTRKITFVAGYSFLPKTNATSIPLVDRGLDEFADEDDDIIDQLQSATIANKSYTGEIRFYTGKKPGARGFYLSLYGRYMDLDATYVHDYDTDFNTYTIPIGGNIKGYGGGLMIGSQWLIAKRVTFDWYIMGGHYGKMKVDLTGTADLSTMTPQERRDLEEDIESINDDLPGNSTIDATVTNTGVSVKGNGPFAGIRGLGFNLGIAF